MVRNSRDPKSQQFIILTRICISSSIILCLYALVLPYSYENMCNSIFKWMCWNIFFFVCLFEFELVLEQTMAMLQHKCILYCFQQSKIHFLHSPTKMHLSDNNLAFQVSLKSIISLHFIPWLNFRHSIKTLMWISMIFQLHLYSPSFFLR